MLPGNRPPGGMGVITPMVTLRTNVKREIFAGGDYQRQSELIRAMINRLLQIITETLFCA